NAIAKRLNKKDQQRVALWGLFKYKAEKHLLKKNTRKLLSGKHPYDHTILLYGIKRIARKSTKKANDLLLKLEKNYQFSVQEKAETASYIAMQDALNHSPYALQHFATIPAQYRDDDSNVWMARMALRQSDWAKVGDAIDAMSEEYQQKDVWRYWKARSLAIAGKVDEALAMYKVLSNDASFYGFIAADHLQDDYHSLAMPEPDRAELINVMLDKNIAIQRALELFKIGFRSSAKREWFYALKAMDKEEKLAAAKLALEKNLPFIAIVSVAKTKDWNQVGLRFPLKFQMLIQKHANTNEIPAAWIYGVTRRESAFDANIASSAKAQGLMQLIPPTAKMVARKLDLPPLAKNDILIPNTNIQLGSAYLKELLQRFNGNFAQASAAYNAGPYRIPKWLPDQELEASRWIESIPFSETRKYVRAVMSYTTIYDYKLNHKTGTNIRLSQRLAAIAPREMK
ncbi:MAG: lytic transglycosylase domain-containing protein, partial [Cocleimonas sp.]|nr:lytic transglycosylase domain-containing protein [Cocleimonas sp.]